MPPFKPAAVASLSLLACIAGLSACSDSTTQPGAPNLSGGGLVSSGAPLSSGVPLSSGQLPSSLPAGTSLPAGLSSGAPLSSGAAPSSGALLSSSTIPRSSAVPLPCIQTPLPGTYNVGSALWINSSIAIPNGTLADNDVIVAVGDDPAQCGATITDVAPGAIWGFNVWQAYGCTQGPAVQLNKVTGDCVANQQLGGAGTACLVEGVIDYTGLRTDLQALLPKATFELFFLQRCSDRCQSWAGQLFTYEAFLKAASRFPTFAAVGTEEQRKRELAAFLANASHETTGGWAGAPGGEHSWGLCNPEELSYYSGGGIGYTSSTDPACQPASGQSYHGRGSIQLSYPSNYCRLSNFMFGDKEILRTNPGRVLTEGELAWASGIFYWMNEDQAPGVTPYNGLPPEGVYYKPSCHMVMTGTWTPRASDITAQRTAGLGATINIINGGLECGAASATHDGPPDRRGFYERYCDMLGIPPVPANWTGTADAYLTCSAQTYFQ